MQPCLYLVVALLVLNIFVPTVSVAKDKHHTKINCDIQNGSCTQQLTGKTVTLEILPRPVKAMKDLTFRVSIDHGLKPESTPYIDLNMPKMDMGRNRVALKLNDKSIFEGTGVIVRCKSGHRVWKATVSVPGIGVVDFIFDVIY